MAKDPTPNGPVNLAAGQIPPHSPIKLLCYFGSPEKLAPPAPEPPPDPVRLALARREEIILQTVRNLEDLQQVLNKLEAGLDRLAPPPAAG